MNDFGENKYGFLPIRLGLSNRRIFAGPYRDKPEGMYGIKLAEEIDLPCDLSLPIQDFGVPESASRLRTALAVALDRVARDLPTYAGCMGGRGRTGLFLALFAKACGEADPIRYVRGLYNPHAVETEEQQEYVENLNLWPLSFNIWKAKGTAGLVDFAGHFGLKPIA